MRATHGHPPDQRDHGIERTRTRVPCAGPEYRQRKDHIQNGHSGLHRGPSLKPRAMVSGARAVVLSTASFVTGQPTDVSLWTAGATARAAPQPLQRATHPPCTHGAHSAGRPTSCAEGWVHARAGAGDLADPPLQSQTTHPRNQKCVSRRQNEIVGWRATNERPILGTQTFFAPQTPPSEHQAQPRPYGHTNNSRPMRGARVVLEGNAASGAVGKAVGGGWQTV